jgi:hypothetical protein
MRLIDASRSATVPPESMSAFRAAGMAPCQYGGAALCRTEECTALGRSPPTEEGMSVARERDQSQHE